MWWAIIKYVGGFFISIVLSVLFSGSVQAWPQNTAPKFVVSSAKVTRSYTCNGVYQDVRVSGEGSINACVMGSGVRVASYTSIQGSFSYAISFPFEDVFYPLDVCNSFRGCSYSEPNDTFVGFIYAENAEIKGVVYSNFTKHLVKSVQNGAVRYGLDTTMPSFQLLHPAGLSFYTQNLATSRNGKWSIFEVRNYGYYRLNNQTMEVRRVAAPGIVYSVYGSNPSVQLAISNDGKSVAIMGEKMSFSVVIVNDTCGDRLTQSTQTTYMGAVTACRLLNTNPSSYVPNYIFASSPSFNQDSNRLSFDVYPYMSETKRVTLFADDSDASSQHLAQYLAIGDSFVSGEGELDDSFYVGGATNRCHVSLRSYPYLIAGSWNLSAHNAACSGATTEAATTKPNGASQLTQLEEVESKLPQLLTIGIGGNDAGLMGKLKTCIGIGTCEWASTATRRAETADEIKKLYPKLKAFYSAAQSKTSGKVVVIGYPFIISTNAVCFAGIGSLLDQTERRFMNEGIRYLNSVVKAAANDTGIEFVDIENALLGSELCSLDISQSMNGLRIGYDYPVIAAFADLKVFGAESFHPNPTGHQKIAQKILTNNSDIFTRPECITCDGYTGVPDPVSYWGSGVIVKHQNTFPFLSTTTVKEGGLFEISFPASSFAADTDITVEMHSTVRSLGKIKAAHDGSAKMTVNTTGFEVGHHSVHVLGKNSSGDEFEAYDFLAVEAITKQSPQVAMVTYEGDKPNNEQSAIKLAKHSINRENVTTSSVMGVTTMSILKPLQPKAGKSTVSNNKNTPGSDKYIIAILVGVASLALLVATSAYVYYRIKQSRYHQ